MPDRFNGRGFVASCKKILEQQEDAILKATAAARDQLKALIDDAEVDDKSLDDLRVQAHTVLSDACANGTLDKILKAMHGKQECDSRCSSKPASNFKVQLSPLQIPQRSSQTIAHVLSYDTGDRRGSDNTGSDAGMPFKSSQKRPSEDSESALSQRLNHDSTCAGSTRENSSNVTKTLLPTPNGLCHQIDSACVASPNRDRRPSFGNDSNVPQTPLSSGDPWDLWQNEPDSARPSRRPSLGHGPGQHSSYGSERNGQSLDQIPDNDLGQDDDDDTLKLLPVWTRRLKKAKTARGVGRRPSTSSGASDMSGGSAQFCITGSALQRRPSMQELRKPFNDEPVVSKQGDKFGRFKSKWESFAMRLILKPNSKTRIVWDIASVFLIVYDMFWIPLQIFEPDNSAFTWLACWMAAVFWCFDVFVSFLSGYNAEGITELRPRKIAAHYIRTWLCFDLIVVLVDWTWLVGTAVVGFKGGSGRAARLGSAFRFLRLLRLLRLLKANGVLSNLIDSVHSEIWLILLGLAKRIFAILVMSHFLACAWYGVGIMDGVQEGSSWVRENNLTDKGLAWRYTTSLHWALTQFTPASMEVVPENAVERGFNVLVVLIAMVTFSYFISSITNAMNRIQSLSSERTRKFSKLRKYLAENKISVELTGRVWSCAQQSFAQKAVRRIHEREVDILSLLPIRLKADLIEEVYTPIFRRYHFFASLFSSHNLIMRKLYSVALEEQHLERGRELFLFGETGEKMFFIFGGCLKFTDLRPEVASLPSALPISVSVGQHACEPVLWVRWKHAGQLIAQTSCELVAVRAAKVQEVLQRMEEPRHYAREFVAFFQKNPLLLRDILAEDMLSHMAELAFTCLDEEKDEWSEPCSPAAGPEFGGFAPFLSPLPGQAPAQQKMEIALTLT